MVILFKNSIIMAGIRNVNVSFLAVSMRLAPGSTRIDRVEVEGSQVINART